MTKPNITRGKLTLKLCNKVSVFKMFVFWFNTGVKKKVQTTVPDNMFLNLVASVQTMSDAAL